MMVTGCHHHFSGHDSLSGSLLEPDKIRTDEETAKQIKKPLL